MQPTYLLGRTHPRLCRPENPPKTLPGRESDRDTGGNGAREHSPPPPRPPTSSCPGRAPSPCFPPAPLPALSAVSLCAIRCRPCPSPSAPPRTPETPPPRRSRFRRRRRRRAGAFSGSRESGVASGSECRLSALARSELSSPGLLSLLGFKGTGEVCGGSLWFSAREAKPACVSQSLTSIQNVLLRFILRINEAL
ncbi:WAS/WASL-interacting protein family member 3-like isoform X1 [Sagmatias obliquidens]|uniref:WAS/WASL-interacting protein family member 3-like isoform X1 n=1 Tax=Sagmatias obliquidens TaxID=3371155 RepID=UPI000F4418DC|nr:WAS/WASL-interacting protein family member 3-like isoform X1 [Lagenorhynchus obliquidens]XP_026950035.1 WAS/WASL-interacting protein family member 3-like isoform X1 [Lagenorhynchus obliquidens]